MRQGGAPQNNSNGNSSINNVVNLSQHLTSGYQAPKKSQYLVNQNNTSYNQNNEISYQPSKQPSQKSNAQKQHPISRNVDSTAKSTTSHQNRGKYNKNVMLTSQQQPSSQNQSINHQLKYQTPTNQNNQTQSQYQVAQLQQNKNKYEKPEKAKVQKKKKYEMTLRLLEGKIIRDYSTLLFKMSTYLTIELKKGKQQFKTQILPSKNPKWNESFKFEVNNIGDVVQITLFNKFTFQKEDKLGYLVFSLEKLENYNTTDWFILYDDDNQQVGSVLINLTSEEIKTISSKKKLTPSESEEGDLDENDVDEELEQSLDYRDHEISRSLIPKNHIKGYNERSFPRNAAGMNNVSQYKGLHTQQQQQSSHSYLNTQTNQARQSVTENSVIRHYSSHSSNSDDLDSPSKPQKHHNYNQNQVIANREIHNRSKNNFNITAQNQSRNNFQQSYTGNAVALGLGDDDQLLPQQLFYGKNQHHSNSSNNLMIQQQQQIQQQHMLQQQNQQQQQQYRNNIHNSQFLYLDEIQDPVSRSHHHQHKNHCKKSKERSNRRTKKHQHNQKDKHKKQHVQQPLHEVEQFVDDIDQNLENDDEEVNYGNYLNQRSQMHFNQNGSNGNQLQQPISASQSQQLLSAFTKHHNINYDSGGATSGSNGGQQQMYSNMGVSIGLSGSGGGNSTNGINGMHLNAYNLGGGSNGSYLPNANLNGPSYFEEQHSIESLNELNALGNHNLIGNNPQMIMNSGFQGIISKNLYDASEIQDIEEAKLQLMKENQIISQQEMQIQQAFSQYKQSKEALNREVHLFQDQEKQFQEMKKNFQIQLDEFNKEKRLLSVQKKEFKYQKQQLERRFLNMKKERTLLSQKQKSIDELYKKFEELINFTKILKNPQIAQSYPIKLDELINLMKGIHYGLQILITSDKFQDLDRLMMEEQQYQQQQNHLNINGHIQQESTSSIATNSTGNYNFLIQGGISGGSGNIHNPLMIGNKHSPINKNSPFNAQRQQAVHNQQLMSQQLTQQNASNLMIQQQNQSLNRGAGGIKNNMTNQLHHPLQIGSSNNSQSSPQVIADIINTEEEDFLDQEELFKKMSPRIQNEEDDFTEDYSSNMNIKKAVDKQKFFFKSNKGQFLNEQHELSTIIEKELLTSQRRSSNGAIGTNTTIDNYRSNQHQQQQQQQQQQNQIIQSQQMIGLSQASAFHMMGGEMNGANLEVEEEKDNQLAQANTNLISLKLAELEGFKKAYIEKLAYLSTIEQQILKNTNDLKLQQEEEQTQANQYISPINNNFIIENLDQNQLQMNMNGAENQFYYSQNDIYSSQQSLNQSQNHQINNRQSIVQITANGEQIVDLSQEQPTIQSQNNNKNIVINNQVAAEPEEDSFDFKPDPNFLMKINQNMLMNDGKFGQNNNQPPSNKFNQPSSGLQINPQMFYNDVYDENEDQEEDQQQQQFEMDYGEQQQPDFQEEEIMRNQSNNENINMNFELINQFNQMQQNLYSSQGAGGDGSVPGMYINGVFYPNNFDINYQSNQDHLQHISDSQYKDFDEALENDQSYDCNAAGTIMHNNKLVTHEEIISQIAPQVHYINQQQQKQVPQQVANGVNNGKIKVKDQEIVQQEVKAKREKLPEDEIIRLINEKYMFEENNKDVSVIYSSDGRIFDQPKKALYGIQRTNNQF